MNKYLIILLTLFFSYNAFSQTETGIAQSIKGKVINDLTNEPVAYTNIGIEGTLYGTASDADGNFELKIPVEMASGQIYFSALSFKNDTFPVQKLFEKEFVVVKLEPQSYDIGDVDIEAQSKVLLRILRMASENTPYNFLGGPFNLVCTYKNEKVTDDTLKTTKNAKVLIYDRTGYKQPSKTDAFKMRKYEITKDKPDYSFSSGITNFDELLELDWVRSATSVLNPGILWRLNLALEDEPEIDGASYWVIAFSQDEPTVGGSQDFHATSFEGKITIAKDDYSVKKIEGMATSDKQNRQGKSLAVGNLNTHYFKDVSYSFEMTYSKLKPESFQLNKTYLFNGKKVEEASQLTVDQVQTTGIKEIATRDYFVE
ncbi:CarboxypepD_reg-like domain-containing protein [Mariniphaga anaerophila]|uniref:CarboxypepD_reg-like domain-containing protein n=1 Tax=Mariniphaga anaerophila TaxID=1484053 RepID=A0A1M5BEI6_9BACT|nr:carboxypeptidase-like regulatory domain-containing protein [Mariniphaga anaerophila]SHF40983.1 CarboxypepD_reg-like domain-containing protein [Mariniphaga anaerophila]